MLSLVVPVLNKINTASVKKLLKAQFKVLSLLCFFFQTESKYKDDPVDLRLDIERRKKHKEKDKRGKSRESVESRPSSHSRERSAEKTERPHKGSKKKYVRGGAHIPRLCFPFLFIEMDPRPAEPSQD